MGPAATRLAATSALRRSWRGVLVLGVLVGAVAGVAGAALAGAGRVGSAYDELLADIRAPDVLIGCEENCTGPDSVAERLTAEPAVASLTTVVQQFVSVTTTDGRYLGPDPSRTCTTGGGELDVLSSDWATTGRPLARIVEGRFPAAGALDEVTLPAITATRAGLRVGDTVTLEADCSGHESDPVPFDPPRSLRVVGIAVGFIDVKPPGQAEYFETLIVSEALADATGAGRNYAFAVWLAPRRSIDDLPDEIRSNVVFDLGERADAIRDDLRPDATALRLFALVASLGAIVVLGQLLAGAVRETVAANRVLGAVGARPRDLGVLGLVHGAAVGVIAAVVAGIVVLLSAPVVPLGVADQIEAGRDVGMPSFAALLTAAVALLAAVLIAAVPAALAARTADRPPVVRAGRWPARAAEALNLRPPPSLGVRFALEPAGAPRRAPLRSSLGALAVSTAAVTGAITFVAGLDHLRSTPRLVGWNWDVLVGPADDDVDALAVAAAAHPGVQHSSRVIIFPAFVSFTPDFTLVPTLMGFDAVPNGVEPSLLQGRAPEGPDELLLAPGLADELGLGIGDIVDLHVTNPLATFAEILGVDWQELPAFGIQEVFIHRFEVVAIGVIPTIGSRLDLGASVTVDGYARLLPTPSRSDVMRLLAAADPERVLAVVAEQAEPDEELRMLQAGPGSTLAILDEWTDEQFAPLLPGSSPDGVVLDVAPGHDPAAVLADLVAGGSASPLQFVPVEALDNDATDLVQLDVSDVGWIPAAFGTLMAAIGILVLAFVVTAGARARRRDVATLRTLGLGSGQTRTAIVWQAVVTALVGLAIGVPVGTVAGRMLWRRYAEGLQVVPEPVTPWPLLAIVCAATLVLALAASVVPGWRESRRPPIESLRAE